MGILFLRGYQGTSRRWPGDRGRKCAEEQLLDRKGSRKLSQDRAIAVMMRLPAFLLIATAPFSFAQLRPSDCARAAKYSESKHGVSILIMQNGKTLLEQYANG